MTTLLYSSDEADLRTSVRALLADLSPHTAVLSRIETARPYDPKTWSALAHQIGVAGLAIPESNGGGGASWREVAVVAEELGRSVAPTPFLGSAVLAIAALSAADQTPLSAELLTELAAGRRTAALAVPLSTMPDGMLPDDVRVDADGRLIGTVTSVADAVDVDVLLVPAVDSNGPALFAVDAGDGVDRRPVVSFDLTRPLTDLSFDAVTGTRLGGAEAIRAALVTGAVVLASEQLGIAEYCLESTIEYVKTRHQFGRPVGSFQAPKHRLADLWMAITQGRAAARYAVGCLAEGSPDLPVAIAVAQAHCSRLAVRAAEECVQLHGGIGFTWEHPAHLYLARAKADAIAFGTPDRHRTALASLVDLPAS